MTGRIRVPVGICPTYRLMDYLAGRTQGETELCTKGTHNQEISFVGRGRSFLDEDPDRLTMLL
jgi:hypothetical protein